ncbi:iron complex outermembrane receptor protein [Rhizobium sp. BK196]|uniref:TonB-dependent siderophore receptor n=1 Tax=Rhizobium sp. BK196 TaxID=2587073 RepID=UPI00160CC1D0|nr:TonB-dependent siderophore receptor [Rhizobium sp. BK196]MBB3309712.1 iron complex outermembrane receptor protein [Rhizobium sp. BK196]
MTVFLRARKCASTTALACALLTPLLPALAQEASPTTLAPIVISGSKDEDPTEPVKGFVASTSATATKTGTPLIETQQSVSVLTADQLTSQNAETVGQALDYVPGVVGEPYGADPRFDSPRIRGFDSRQAQFLNGLRMMRTAGAPAVDPYQLERIEVLRGPASVMYGQGNPGGMINLISKRPIFERFGEIGVQAGSYDTYGTYFDFGDIIPGNSDFAYRLTGLARTASAQVDELDNDRYFIAPALTWQPDEDTKLTILTSIQHDNPSTPSSLPPQLTLNASHANRLSRDFFVGDKSFDKSDRTLTNLGYELEHRLNDTWTFRQNFRYQNFDWNYQALGMSTQGLTGGRTINRNATFQDELLNTFNVDNNLLAEFDTGDIRHKMLFGLDYRYYDNNVGTQFWRATPLDAFNPVYGSVNLIAPTLSTYVDSTMTQVGLYVQDELAYENWRATAALRQDWASTAGTSTNRLTGLSRSLDKDDQKLTGRAGLSYVFDNGIAPYISYATSFEPVPVPATGGPLQPTTGEQVEVGIKYQPQGWNGYFTVAAYDLKQKNVLTTIGGVPVQIGEVDVKGTELEGVTSLTDGLDLRAAYTYMQAEIVGGVDDGKRPDNVPEHAASLWLDYTFPEDTALEGFGLGGGIRYVGQRYGDTKNTLDLDAVTLFDAAVHYKKDNMTASLNVKNLADRDYVASCSAFGCTYGDGRTVMGRLTFQW